MSFHVRLLVTDFDECFRFYRDRMLFEVSFGEDGSSYADFNVGDGMTMALFDRNEMAEVIGTSSLPSSASSQDRVALIVGVDDVDEKTQRLRASGVQIVTDPRDRPQWGIRTAHLRDPDGNLVEINSPLATSEWTPGLREVSNQTEGA